VTEDEHTSGAVYDFRRARRRYRHGRSLHPIRVVECPDGRYIVDGRHRVSVALALRQTHIEAWVVPLAGSRSAGGRAHRRSDGRQGAAGRIDDREAHDCLTGRA
jgi:hypothetical protein